MKLRQQIVQDHIDRLAEALSISEDEAFLRFVWSLLTLRSVHLLDPIDLIEGGQDKQIDVMTIDDDQDQAAVYILQAKNTLSFSSNSVIQMRNGLNWIFNKPRADVRALSNNSFKDKILEYRSTQSGIGPSNITITVLFATNGLTETISDEFKEEAKTIIDEYDIGTFEAFKLLVWGADELVAALNIIERTTRRIDADIKVRYDANNPSLIQYYAEDLKGLVCTAPASEIARIVNSDPTGAIFDLNVRSFLGTRGAVNADIQDTCTRPEASYQFWFLNNGITIVCDHFDPVTDPDNAHVKVRNMQIVNGCQTASTIALALRDGHLSPDVRVLLRVYQTEDREVVNKIVLTTNNQNKITSRNLRANDPIQIDMERAFQSYDYYYERKPRQFDGPEYDPSRIMPNEIVAQAYLSVVMKKPSDGRGRKYKVWGELYNRVFSGQSVEPYIIATLIAMYAKNWLRNQGFTTVEEELRRKVAKVGTLHVARIAAYLWRGSDEWRIDRETLQQELDLLESDISILDPKIAEALHLLEDILRQNDQYVFDVDRALKSYTLDEDISTRLHT
jgi:hypothetical protein